MSNLFLFGIVFVCLNCVWLYSSVVYSYPFILCTHANKCALKDSLMAESRIENHLKLVYCNWDNGHDDRKQRAIVEIFIIVWTRSDCTCLVGRLSLLHQNGNEMAACRTTQAKSDRIPFLQKWMYGIDICNRCAMLNVKKSRQGPMKWNIEQKTNIHTLNYTLESEKKNWKKTRCIYPYIFVSFLLLIFFSFFLSFFFCCCYIQCMSS